MHRQGKRKKGGGKKERKEQEQEKRRWNGVGRWKRDRKERETKRGTQGTLETEREGQRRQRVNGERRKGGDKRQKEFKQERSTSVRMNERTNEPTWSQRGERDNARLDSAGERGLLRRKRRQRGSRIGRREGEGKSSRKMKSGWYEQKRERKRGRGEKTQALEKVFHG